MVVACKRIDSLLILLPGTTVPSGILLVVQPVRLGIEADGEGIPSPALDSKAMVVGCRINKSTLSSSSSLARPLPPVPSSSFSPSALASRRTESRPPWSQGGRRVHDVPSPLPSVHGRGWLLHIFHPIPTRASSFLASISSVEVVSSFFSSALEPRRTESACRPLSPALSPWPWLVVAYFLFNPHLRVVVPCPRFLLQVINAPLVIMPFFLCHALKNALIRGRQMPQSTA